MPHDQHRALLANALELSPEALSVLLEVPAPLPEVSRRDFLEAAKSTTVVAATTTADPWSVVPRRPSSIDPMIVEQLAALRHVIVRDDAQNGSRGLLIHGASLQLALVETLVRTAPSGLRPKLFEVGAMFAELAGWLSDDTGDPTEGRRWTDRALDLAHASGSPSVTGYILMRKAQQATEEGHGARAVGLARSATRLELPRRVRAAALLQQAHGHALEGDEAEVHRAADQANEALEGGAEYPMPEPFELAGFCGPAYVAAQRGLAMRRLGRFGDAAAAFDDALSKWPGGYTREHGLHLARKATVMAADRQFSVAARVGRRALRVARTASSARTLTELRAVARMVDDSTGPEVVAFREELALTSNEVI